MISILNRKHLDSGRFLVSLNRSYGGLPMHKFILSMILFLATPFSLVADDKMPDTAQPKVKLTTNLGEIVIQLNPQKAPISSENFLTYVKEGFYDGTLFHRVIKGFMAQGGGFDASLKQKTTHATIKNESNNGLLNNRGSVAMARTQEPDSATAQFYINYSNNDFLNFKNPTFAGIGYAVFAEVIEGMAVVDAMAEQATESRQGYNDIPVKDIVIEKAEIVE
jgi:peptidyl-prolyl cis-trans isomerase B (cyclophilin B)